MKIPYSVIFILIQFHSFAQIRSEQLASYSFPKDFFPLAIKTPIHGLWADPPQSYRPAQPIMTNAVSGNSYWIPNRFFWTNTTTTMSFNSGKFGTYYYWDVQGNLRNVQGFIDLSGKNKRGFKLLFPWRIK